jgi:hypothetical protein
VRVHDEVDKSIDSNPILDGRLESVIDGIQPKRGHVVEGV